MADHRVGVDPRRAFTGQAIDVLALDLDGAVARLLGLLQHLNRLEQALPLASPLTGHGASVHSDRALTRQKRSLGTVHLDRPLSGPLIASVHSVSLQLPVLPSLFGKVFEAATTVALQRTLSLGLLLSILRGLETLPKRSSDLLSKIKRGHGASGLFCSK